jgi:mannose-1-phosphate guanylyltransferase
MKAFLLAAGRGTRLRPLTDTLPKCLVPVQGRPLLAIWLELFQRHGVDAVLINTHHLAGQVERVVADLQGCFRIDITLRHEPELLGSGGTLWINRRFVSGEQDFLIAYGDNLTDTDLSAMVAFHRQTCRSNGGLLTMGLIRVADPCSCGVVTLDAERRIVGFTEKPADPESNLANGGIYVASPEVFDAWGMMPLRPEPPLDLGFDVLPRLTGKMFGFMLNGYLRDIGTPESYRAALAEWPSARDADER